MKKILSLLLLINVHTLVSMNHRVEFRSKVSEQNINTTSDNKNNYFNPRTFFNSLSNDNSLRSNIWERAKYNSYNQKPENPLVEIVTMQQQGNKKGIELKIKELENSYTSSKMEIFQIKLILDDPATDLLDTIANGSSYQAVEAYKDLNKLAPFKYQYPQYNDKNLSPEKYNAYHEKTVNEHAKQKGYNQLEAGKYLLENRSDFKECIKMLDRQTSKTDNKNESKTSESKSTTDMKEVVEIGKDVEGNKVPEVKNESGISTEIETNNETVTIIESENNIVQDDLISQDLITTIPPVSKIQLTQKQIDELIQNRIKNLNKSDSKDFEQYQEAITLIMQQINDTCQPVYEAPKVFVENVIDSFFNRITSPHEIIKDQILFFIHTGEFIGEVIYDEILLCREKKLERLVGSLNDLYSSAKNISFPSAEELGKMVGTIAADIVFLGGASKAVSALKKTNIVKKVSEKAGRVIEGLSEITLEQKIATTPEGITVEVSQKIEDLSSLKNTTEKIVPNEKLPIIKQFSTTVNEGPIAILKDGYYEVNGFKFSEYYYNRLWDNGRGAPSLLAQEILENSTTCLLDVKSGFFKYQHGGWEIVYNPTTKEVWHLAPIKKIKL